MITVDVVQGSPEWFAVRRGVPSASNFDKIITTKGEPSKQAQKYMFKLAAERVSKAIEDTYQSDKMTQAIALESEARELYEIVKGVSVEQVGICFPDDARRIAASPDGLVERDGLLEIKCPLSYTHVEYLLDGVLPTDYFQQAQGQLFVTGRKWVDFMSYYPGIKPFIIRVRRDEKFITALVPELERFCAELDQITERIK